MKILVTIDPGKNTGWAVFRDGVLFSAFVERQAEALGNHMIFADTNLAFDVTVLGELPMVYPGPRAEDPNDLIQLAEQLGELLGLYRSRGFRAETVHPRTWKGTVPKDVHNQSVLSKLTPAELTLVPKMPRAKRYQSDAVDAVGIGLWKLRRM